MITSYEEKKKEIVMLLIKNNILIDKKTIEKITESNIDNIQSRIKSTDFLFSKKSFTSLFEKKEDKNIETKTSEGKEENNSSSLKIIQVYEDVMEKKKVSSFVGYFNIRYKTIKNLLMNRIELATALSIRRILEKKEKETVSTIGLVYSKQTTKNGNVVLELEDPSGTVKVLVNKDKRELFELANSLVLDEVIGISGVYGGNIIFANVVLIPDVPFGKEIKKSPDEVYAIVLSDLHVGSTFFLDGEFNKFLSWINSSIGSEKQREVAKKVKYIFILGDLIDGVGIYPSQQLELNIDDIYEQYNYCASLLDKIPKDKKIIIIPGNHDAMRLTEPQPVLFKDFASRFWDIPNITLLTNPSYVNIHSSEGFPGFDVLLYHGYSFDYFADTVDMIRQKRPNVSDRVDLVQKFLLQRRHLAPTHSSTLHVQDTKKDPLVINIVPDFFLTGHIHKAVISNYKNITTISGSCFQSKTPFQEKVGHEPEPGKIPLVNLQTREVKMLKFTSDKGD